MSTKCLSVLLNEPLVWMITPHGDGYALGWEGVPEYIEKAYALFVNCYTPAKGGSPILLPIHEHLSYIYLPNLRVIRNTLAVFFETHAVRDREVAVYTKWREAEGEYVYGHDEVAAAKLGSAAADEFMQHIKPTAFLPAVPKPLGDEYGLGQLISNDYTPVEDCASRSSV